MRIVYTADLHGNIANYQQTLQLAIEYEAQAVIVGGDLLPHAIKIDQAVQTQRAFIQHDLQLLFKSFRQQHPHIAIYLLAGNDDWMAAIATLSELERAGLVYALHNNVFQLTDTLWLGGYACVPITPFSIKDYERLDDDSSKHPLPSYSFAMAYTSANGKPERTSLAKMLAQPSIARDLKKLAQRSNPAQTIYVCHSPPYNTMLDQTRSRHKGSYAIRAFIEEYQPPLTLHGHIHESPQFSNHYSDRIGKTWCLNPGHDDRQFYAITLDTDDIEGTLMHTVYGAVTNNTRE